MKKLVILAAAMEIPTGLVLILRPTVFTQLLFGVELSGPGPALGSLGGFALLALVIACWPPRGHSAPSTAAVHALLAFSFLCAAYLAYQGIVGERAGPLLWPAVAGHAALALLLLRSWLMSQRRSTTSR